MRSDIWVRSALQKRHAVSPRLVAVGNLVHFPSLFLFFFFKHRWLLCSLLSLISHFYYPLSVCWSCSSQGNQWKYILIRCSFCSCMLLSRWILLTILEDYWKPWRINVLEQSGLCFIKRMLFITRSWRNLTMLRKCTIWESGSKCCMRQLKFLLDFELFN